MNANDYDYGVRVRTLAKGHQAVRYLQTSTGRLYWATPASYIFTIDEIAHCLARICRFNGHMGWESVARHSLNVAARVAHMSPAVQLGALLHDAHEAYVGDVAGPLLRAGLAPGLVVLGHRIQHEIHKQLAPELLGLTLADHAAIHEADSADCARTLSSGAEWRREDAFTGDVAAEFVALYGHLARGCAP